jgi:NitT/TauT family transport system ATP-binding protein
VPFPYPRDPSLHEDPLFGQLRSRVRSLVMREYAAQARQTNEANP